MEAEVVINLKKGVSDPEGAQTKKALNLLGFENVREVKSVKAFRIYLDEEDEEAARAELENICKRLLANPVIHEYAIKIDAV
ncbi:MAG: phosphoribosylformylglycinamidine synthase subunit PurS [Halobacteriota archaeon]|nr:phosphoribosylformylglycinamidine synthase subunit PurS [Halobacteriota archaeon]